MTLDPVTRAAVLAHKDRTTKYYDRDMGVCVCAFCRALPWHIVEPMYDPGRDPQPARCGGSEA